MNVDLGISFKIRLHDKEEAISFFALPDMAQNYFAVMKTKDILYLVDFT